MSNADATEHPHIRFEQGSQDRRGCVSGELHVVNPWNTESFLANIGDAHPDFAEALVRGFNRGPTLEKLCHAVAPFVARTFDEARDAEDRGERLLYCSCDVLNPCWPEGKPWTGEHWGGKGDCCPECTLRAALATATQ